MNDVGGTLCMIRSEDGLLQRSRILLGLCRGLGVVDSYALVAERGGVGKANETPKWRAVKGGRYGCVCPQRT